MNISVTPLPVRNITTTYKDGNLSVMSLNTLTPEQQEACDKFLGFLLSEEKEFYLFGAAGCGKTFLTQHFISELVDKYKNTAKMLGLPITDYVIAVTATTNKAVEVLNQGKVFNGDLYVETIYKLLGIVVKEDYSTGKTYLTDTNKQLVIYDSIIFIDECSMLPTQMLNYIRKKTKNCKIIFIGDSYQLAPVNEKPHWNSTPENVTVSLKTPVRNQNKTSLISLCSQLRKNVDDNTANGFIEGMEDGTFKPQNPATRAQAATIILRVSER